MAVRHPQPLAVAAATRHWCVRQRTDIQRDAVHGVCTLTTEQDMCTPSIRGLLWALLMGIALLTAACASTPRPTDLLALATDSVAHAVGAGANESAPVEMTLARDKLTRATVAMAANKNDVARLLAGEAQVDAQLAEAKAQAKQARKAADAVNADGHVLREELDRKAN
jgi:hypothetical protein